MIEFLDMNDDCVEEVLKNCDPDSIVAMSQTCNKLKSLATPLFKKHTKYDDEIESEEDLRRVKRTIASLGNHLVELNVNFDEEYNIRKSMLFVVQLPQKCPNLEIWRVVSQVSADVVLASARGLRRLKDLSVRRPHFVYEVVDRSTVLGLARELKQLESFEISEADWNEEMWLSFVFKNRNLKRFSCEIDGISLDADHHFLETIRFNRYPRTAASDLLKAK